MADDNDSGGGGAEDTDSNSHLVQAIQQLTFVTKQKVDEEIGICLQELRSRLNIIVDDQQRDTDYMLGYESTVQCAQQALVPPLVPPSSLMEQSMEGAGGGEFFVPVAGRYPLQQRRQQPEQPEQQDMVYGSDGGADETSDYYTGEQDQDGSDLSMHSAHYSEEMVENRKNLYVMRILTSIMSIHNIMNKSNHASSNT